MGGRSAAVATSLALLLASCGGGGARPGGEDGIVAPDAGSDERTPGPGGEKDASDEPGDVADGSEPLADGTSPADAGGKDGGPDDGGEAGGPEPGTPDFGEPCTDNGDCLSGWCVDGPDGPICTRRCSTSCPDDFVCRAILSRADPVFLCVPRFERTCTPCADDAQCENGACIELDEGDGRCAPGCDGDEDCDEGFECTERPSGEGEGTWCLPASGSCTCLPGDEGDTRSCSRSNDRGVCFGEQTCDPESGWSDCSAAEPAAEVCNGLDDDCNAVTDDVAGRGESCTLDNEHGSCPGTRDCTGEAETLQCVGPTPAPEACNGTDDDCDGATDEDFDALFEVCQAGEGLCRRAGVRVCADDGEGVVCDAEPAEPGEEICNGLDDDCDGATDEASAWADRGEPCAVGEGVCRATGTFECDPEDPAAPVVCSATPGEPGEESCNGLDDDCDGATDEGEAWSDLGAVCTVGEGVCSATGTKVCDPDAPSGPTICSAEPESGGEEICNNLDDDCDGTVDEGAAWAAKGEGCFAGQGGCAQAGVLVCDPEDPAGELRCSATPGEPSEETCDGSDEDCDGAIDEGLAAEPCPLQEGVCEGATRTCAGTLGFQDCDAQTYGEDYESEEVSCDGMDNDCDGETDEVDLDGDGEVAEACGGTDCDDLNPLVGAEAEEICGDGLDNDCSGTAEDRDADGDGAVAAACGGADCNDDTAKAAPDLDEVCGDGLDNDCDGQIDDRDRDGDTFLHPDCGGNDCNDDEASVHPGAEEACNGLDNDCNGVTDDKDLDGDGYVDDDPQCGGDDCNDDDVFVNPGRAEVCGNDVDEDCSGTLDDRDRDGDGYVDDDPDCGGTDCDDGAPLVHPDMSEYRDARDNECDGLVDEGLLDEGALVVSEVMKDPEGVSDAVGEWFEVQNTTAKPVNLASFRVTDADGPDAFDVLSLEGVRVPPGGAAVLCRNPESTFNGGVECDYGYDDFILANTDDEVILRLDGKLIDRVDYRPTQGFPDPSAQTMSLDPGSYDATANDDGASWCLTPNVDGVELDSGDDGSPGRVNPTCSGAPALVAVRPTSGVDDGGETVTVIGSELDGTTEVRVGGTPCASTTVVDERTVECVTPSGEAGPADVAVEVGDATRTLDDAYRYTAEGDDAVASCALLEPFEVAAAPGERTAILHGRATVPGTTGGEGAPSGLRAQLGHGPAGSDPRSAAGWTWRDALHDGGEGDADRYRMTLVAPDAGPRSVAFRVSTDGGTTWTHCDRLPGTSNGFEPSELGTLTVE